MPDEAVRAALRRRAQEADGFHCNPNRHGPQIEGCTVLNTADDTGNLYGRAASAVARLPPRQADADGVPVGERP